MTIDPNDPKLTAYALGELDQKEHAEIEAQVEQSVELREAVDGIRKTADLLTSELQGMPVATLADNQREAIVERAALNGKAAPSSKALPFWRRYWVPTSLAASVLIVVGLTYSLMPGLSRARDSKGMWDSVALVQPAPAYNLSTSNDSDRRTKKASLQSTVALKERAMTRKREQRGKLKRISGGGPSLFADSGGRSAPGASGVRSDAMVSLKRRVYVGGREALDPRGRTDVLYGYQVEFELDAETDQRLFDGGFQTESYDHIVENPFLMVRQNPLSTFSIDVDTASYANVRRFLNQNKLPPAGAVRIEEMVNYFNYDYPLPLGDDPFSVIVDVAQCPWNPDHLLARIGIKGQEFAADEQPIANLVFLIDVSGSMQAANKLPLLKQSMEMLVNQLSPDDSVAMVVYAGASGVVLPATSCRTKGYILSALDRLRAGGSTNGAAGIELAYQVAVDNFIPGGINRVILATDGDFNVGVTSQSSLIDLIEKNAKSGVFLSVLGFGMGNYKDATLEHLADKGNGNYAYIDTANEARKVLVDQLSGTLMTIAKDVKTQIEFNPAEVSAYRLIGYENRLLAARDFNDDTKDAGEIGAGHTVTAFYEIVPAGVEVDLPSVDPLKYQPQPSVGSADGQEVEVENSEVASGELMTVKLRYKEPDGQVSKLIEMAVSDAGLSLSDMSDDFVFAASVASFGMLLRSGGSIPTIALETGRQEPNSDFTIDAVMELASGSMGEDPFGYRSEFLDLLEKTQTLQQRLPKSQRD